MVRHEASYRLSQPVPLGATLMLLAKWPMVTEAFTLKYSSSKLAVTTASKDGIGFCPFVCFFSELQPWFTGMSMSNAIGLLEVKFLDQYKMMDKATAFAKNVFINLR